MAKIYIPEDSPFLAADSRKNRWAIPYSFECLNARIDNLLGRNEDAIRGKSILDIGSHIGTFSYAACQMEARSVHGIDTEEKTVLRCLDLFHSQKVPDSQFRFEVQDAFDFLEKLPENSFDTVFCFGMLYYTGEPYRLLRLMGRVARETVLLDTFTAAYAAIQGKDSTAVYPAIQDATLDLPLMIVSLTQPEKKDYRLPQWFRHKGKILSQIALPTRALLEIWFQSLAMDFKFLDWSQSIRRPCSYRDLLTPEQKQNSHWADVYASGVRVAYRLDTKRP